MKSYKTISALSHDARNLKEGENIIFRGEKMTYTSNLIYLLLASRDNLELGLGAMVEDDFNQLRVRYGNEEERKND